MAHLDNPEIINRILARGETFYVDPSGYRYNLSADCPDDGVTCSLVRTDKEHGIITRVLFECGVCGKRFKVEPNNLYLC
jgi:hypothetical protein